MKDDPVSILSDHRVRDEELQEVFGGRSAVKKFKCSRCGKMAMVVKYKKFVCLECKFERPM